MKKLQVNAAEKTFEFEIRLQDGRMYIKRNGIEQVADLARLGHNRYSLILSGKSHEVGAEPAPEGYIIFTNSRSGHFVVEDYDVARMKKKAGIDEGRLFKKVTAPMPGLVVTVNCKSGDEVKKGDALLVMEAMKMENEIKSPARGKIKVVNVAAGVSVDKGQVLLEFE